MRQWRVRWQRLGMSRVKVRTFETQAAAERLALKLQGRMAEAYPELNPSHTWCCAWSNPDCGCGGETYAERWERESAQVPPLVFGPALDSREVGEWERQSLVVPEQVPPETVEAFRKGGGFWPIREPVAAATGLDGDLGDIPF